LKSFRSIVVLKRPRRELWSIMRDHLVAVAGNIADIAAIRQIERSEGRDGEVHIVNEWRMRQQIPDMMRAMLKIDELYWIDRNRWDDRAAACSWTIEPGFLAEFIACSGTTSFADAMGGQGTRITFAGEIDLRPGLLASLGSMESVATELVESIVSTMIPQNLRAVAEAAAAFDLPEGTA
jgi:hypothetical protein